MGDVVGFLLKNLRSTTMTFYKITIKKIDMRIQLPFGT